MTSALLPLVQRSLDAHAIIYKVFECDPDLADTAVFCEKYGFDLDHSANAILVAGKSDPVRYACCVILATTKLDVNKKVCQLLGVRKASFAPREAAIKFSQMEYGGVTAFGLPDDIPIYVDASVIEHEEVVMGGGNRSSKVLINPSELKKLPAVQIIEGLAKAKN
jgi:prolyl-tRNA editing enzyme YbaK/EbsC (Cys-tRNA(Pro) deacylase)